MRRSRGTLLGAFLALCGLGAGVAGVRAEPVGSVQADVAILVEKGGALFRDEADELVARTAVPSPERKVGEVRLLRRGDVDVVQTLLDTRILRRVVGEIRAKEGRNWPEGKEGHEDAVAYGEALSRAQEILWERQPKFGPNADPRQRLMIEMALSAKDCAILLAEYEAEEDSTARLRSRRPLAVLRPQRSYLLRNMRLVLADSFPLKQSDLATLLDESSHLGTVAEGAVAPAVPRQESR